MFFIPYLLGKLLLIPQDLYKAFFISLRPGYAVPLWSQDTLCISLSTYRITDTAPLGSFTHRVIQSE